MGRNKADAPSAIDLLFSLIPILLSRHGRLTSKSSLNLAWYLRFFDSDTNLNNPLTVGFWFVSPHWATNGTMRAVIDPLKNISLISAKVCNLLHLMACNWDALLILPMSDKKSSNPNGMLKLRALTCIQISSWLSPQITYRSRRGQSKIQHWLQCSRSNSVFCSEIITPWVVHSTDSLLILSNVIPGKPSP